MMLKSIFYRVKECSINSPLKFKGEKDRGEKNFFSVLF